MITCTLLICAAFGELVVTGWGIGFAFVGDMILTGIFSDRKPK